jgi:hypothetical protein
VHALSLEAPALSIRSADLQPMPQPVNGSPRESKNGNNGNEEDHEPAVV